MLKDLEKLEAQLAKTNDFSGFVVHLRSLFIDKFTSWTTISSQFMNTDKSTEAMHESNVWNVCNKFIISSLLTKTKKKRSAFILVAIRSR
jgi:hypothetical protein